VLACLGANLYLRRDEMKEWWQTVCKFDYTKLNLAWLLCIAALAVITVMNVTKTMYFPTFDTDSIRGFDLMGMAVGHEGTIKKVSIFTDVNYAESQRGPGSYMTYTPLTQLAYAYAYMLGTETSKIINALMFISFLIAFYGVLTRFATHLLAALATIFMTITPEMLGFSSMSGTNYIHALYASIGIICFVIWHYKKIPSFLWLSAAMLMLNNWARNEGLAFIGAACCILLWHSIKDRQYKKLLIFGSLCVFPFIFWNIFLKVYHFESESVIIAKPFWDAEKASIITSEVWMLFKNGTYYGLTFSLFIIVLLSNVWNIYKRGDQAVTLLLTVLSCLFYTILVYQINYLWDDIHNVLRYSYKRFLFSFVPLVWFYIAANQNVKWLFDKAE
jgi:hypothetical protein